MARRKLDAPYSELGNKILSWREAKHRSALALFRECKFSFSYSTYVDYERGVNLPSIEDLLELTLVFGADAREAALLWARVQMPTPELRDVFGHSLENTKQFLPAVSDQTKPDLENSWVFGPGDFKLFEAHTWLWDVILLLCMNYPAELPFARLGLAGAPLREFLGKTIRHWVESGNVLASETGIQLRLPHVHVPNTDAWFELRNRNTERAVANVLSGIDSTATAKKEAYRETIHRLVSRTELNKWIERMGSFSSEFRASATSSALESDLYAMVLVLGKRQIGNASPAAKSPEKKKKRAA